MFRQLQHHGAAVPVQCVAHRTNSADKHTHKLPHPLSADSIGALLSKNTNRRYHAYDVYEAASYGPSCYFRDVGVLARAMSIASVTGLLMIIMMANNLSYNGLRPSPPCLWARKHMSWPIYQWALDLDTTTIERSSTPSRELPCRLQHTERAARHLTPRKTSVRGPIPFPETLYVAIFLTQTTSSFDRRREISSVHLPVTCHRALAGLHPRPYWSGRVCLSQSPNGQLDSEIVFQERCAGSHPDEPPAAKIALLEHELYDREQSSPCDNRWCF